MTQLQLVEVDAQKEIETRTVKAVSSSYKSLEEYCKETFGKNPGKPEDLWNVYYEVEESDIEIVQCNQNRFE